MWDTLLPLSIATSKIVERLKTSFDFIKGNVTTLVSLAVGAVFVYGFGASLGIPGAEDWADKIITTIVLGTGAGIVNTVESRINAGSVTVEKQVGATTVTVEKVEPATSDPGAGGTS